MSLKPLLILALTLLSSVVRAENATVPAVNQPVPTDKQVKTEVSAEVTQNITAFGFGGMDRRLARARNAHEAQDILQSMREAIPPTANEQYKAIAQDTIQRLSDKLKTDEDFKAHRDELPRLPKMLTIQILSDQFDTERKSRPYQEGDDKKAAEYQRQYGDLMSDSSAGKTPAGQVGADKAAQAMAGAHAMSHAAMGLEQGAQKTASDAPPAKSLMDEFHVDYRAAKVEWESNHAPPPPTPSPNPGPGPSPAPGPGPNPGGGGEAPAPNPGGNGASPIGPGGYVPGFPPPGHIQDMISANPGQPANWQLSADYKLQTGDFHGALSDARRAVSLGGGADAQVSMGEAMLSLGDKAGANEAARAALESQPENRRAMALYHFSEDRTAPKAPKSLGDGFGSAGAERMTPGSALSGAAAANLAAGASRLNGDQARKEAANALRLNDTGAALVYVNRALELDPNNPALLNLRASIFARQGLYDKAAQDAQAGLKLAPKNAALLRTLGYARLRGKDYKDALASANALINLNPKDAYAYALRAHADGSMGDRDAMMADIRRAAALDSRFQPAAEQLAALVQLPGDKDMLFLFPGEAAPAAVAAAPAPAGRGRSFGLLVAASAAGGLLLALGLLQTVLAPWKEKITSVFTRVPAGAAPAVADTARPASAAAFLPGAIRGQYEITRQIGQGGMGMVFEGTDRSLGRRVAIKKMRDELKASPQERARFVAEAKTVAALHHPNIVDIYAIAEDGDDVFLVFEYVDGKTVHELIQTRALTPAQALKIARASAEALGFAHSRSVIHRDMKPSNVMVDSSGRVKVMDFGIARMAKDSATRYSMTNTVVGTPPYMAPEQERGQVRKESDVYALAVCAYEMLTGALPFQGATSGMLLNKINMSYVAPSRAAAGLPEAVDAVFAKAFQADPDQRYRTPTEFADALDAAFPAAARA